MQDSEERGARDRSYQESSRLMALIAEETALHGRSDETGCELSEDDYADALIRISERAVPS